MPGAGGEDMTLCLESRDWDPRQLYCTTWVRASSFSCFHKGLLVVVVHCFGLVFYIFLKLNFPVPICLVLL